MNVPLCHATMSVDTRKHPAGRHAASIEIPEVMHAAALDRFGGPDVLTIHKLPVPSIDKGEVLIALHTAGVGRWDADMREGWYPGDHPTFPLILGTDGSGKVVAMGSHVRRFKLDDPVYAYSFANPKGGFYAQYVAVAAENVAPVPSGLTMREAGAIPTTGLTALQGIDDALHVKRSESVVVVGASGGVGTLAIQFAKLREARVLAIAAGEDGAALARRLGADDAVDGLHGDVSGVLRRFLPVDAVLALVGGEVTDSIVANVKSGGAVAYPNGIEPAPRKRHGIRMIPYDAEPGVRQFDNLALAVEAAKLQVPIAATFSLGDASRAHKRLDEGHVFGKIVLDIN